MAAIGQGGGAGAPAGGAPGGQPGGAPAAGAPGGQPQNTDPFGFAAAAAAAPEHLRPMLQQEFDRLTPQLQQRIAPYEPLQPYLDRLSPLLESGRGEDGQPTPPILDGLLELFAMTQDETRLEDLADWWTGVGQSYGFFDDEDGGDGGAGGGGLPDPGDPAGNGQPPADPRDAQIAQLTQAVQSLTQRIEQGEQQTAQQQAVAEQTTKINQEMTQNLRAVGLLKGDEDFDPKSQVGQDVLALAFRYQGDAQAIPKAVADYVRMTGQGQAQLLGGDVADTSGVEALRAALEAGNVGNGNGGLPGAPQPALGRGEPSSEPTQIRTFEGAREAALARLRTG